MMTVQPVINFPVIGVSTPRSGGQYAFVARTELEMRESPLHSFLRGNSSGQYFVDCSGQRFEARNMKINGLDISRFREIGVFTSLLSGLVTGGNFPIMLAFDLEARGGVALDELRNVLSQCVTDNPRFYTWNVSERTVRARLHKARSFEELADAIARKE